MARAKIAVVRDGEDDVLCVEGALVAEDPDRLGDVALRFRPGSITELGPLPAACEAGDHVQTRDPGHIDYDPFERR